MEFIFDATTSKFSILSIVNMRGFKTAPWFQTFTYLAVCFSMYTVFVPSNPPRCQKPTLLLLLPLPLPISHSTCVSQASFTIDYWNLIVGNLQVWLLYTYEAIFKILIMTAWSMNAIFFTSGLHLKNFLLLKIVFSRENNF